MAVPRLLIPKTVWHKIQTKLERPEHAQTRAQLRATKVSNPPSGEAVLWDPDEPLRQALLSMLEREETFVRRKGTCSHKDLTQTIRKLRGTIQPNT